MDFRVGDFHREIVFRESSFVFNDIPATLAPCHRSNPKRPAYTGSAIPAFDVC